MHVQLILDSSHIPHAISQEIVLTVPSKYIQDPTSSHYFTYHVDSITATLLTS